jgi:hypothetical protein
MAFNPSQFADDTDFERFTLDRLGPHRVRVAEPGLIYRDEANPKGRSSITVKLPSLVNDEAAREELRRSLRPVGFGAAYKILDMLVEHVLRANGLGPGPMDFKQKRKALSSRPATLPVPLDAHHDLWDRLAKVYVAFIEARHAITHRRAQVTQSGDLEGYDNHRALSDTFRSPEVAAFAAAVHAIAEAVIDVDADVRRTDIVAWHLNTLDARHGLPTLPATDPEAGRGLLVSDLLPLENGLLRFDVARARHITTDQPPSLWDLELRANERVFVGRWEDVPNASDEVEFHPASPPAWLSERAV